MRWYKRRRREWLKRNADIHIVSFPKCGRTWLVMMLSKVIERHYGVSIDNPLKLRRYRKRVPGLPLILQHHDGGPEFQRVEELETDKSRLYAGKKVLFLVRDPRDVTVSAYFQKTKRNYDFEGSLDAYVRHPVGSIETNIEFFNIWARNRDVPADFLLMTYEGMHEDTEGELRRAVEFIGLRDVPSAIIKQAVDDCRFDKMRQMESSNAIGARQLAPRDPSDTSTYKTREGRAGGYVKHLGKAEIEFIDRLIDERLDDLYSFYKRDSMSTKAG